VRSVSRSFDRQNYLDSPQHLCLVGPPNVSHGLFGSGLGAGRGRRVHLGCCDTGDARANRARRGMHMPWLAFVRFWEDADLDCMDLASVKVTFMEPVI
jgi:hypothetical protein